MGGLRQLCRLKQCVTPMTQSFQQCRCHVRFYATKGKRAAHVIRWNAENKLLFGSKQKLDSGKALSPTSASKATKKPKTKAKVIKTNSDVTKSPQGHRLQDMAAMSGEFHSEETMRLDEEEQLMKLNPVDSSFRQDVHSQEFFEEDSPSDRLESGTTHLRGSNRKHEKVKLEIPKILPVPPSQATGRERTLKSQKDVKDKGTVSIASSKDLDFILQCPLFPESFPESSAPAQSFSQKVEGLGLRVLPTVKTVLNKTRPDLSNFFLQRWREKMIQELGEDGFKKHQEATIWQGTTLHACILQFLSGTPVEDIQIQESNEGHWRSVSTVLPHVTDVQAQEANVTHPLLLYKGTFDCIARYKDTLCVIDWKTSSKPKPLLSNLFDNPLQVVAYLGAISHSADFKSKFGGVEQAAIVVAYPNGEAAHVHMLSRALCQQFWGEWCHRLHQYWATAFAEKLK